MALRLGRRILVESIIVSLIAFGADLATTLYGLWVGLIEQNPLSALIGFPAFVGLSLLIQLAATVAVSSTWMAFNGHWRTGFLFASAPRFVIALLNLRLALLR